MSTLEHCGVYTPSVTVSHPMSNGPSQSLWAAFGAWIKEERQSQRLSQAEVARRAGIDRQQWYRIEAGKSGSRRDTVIAIAEALGLDPTLALEQAGYSASTEDRHKLPEGVTVYFDSTSHLTDEQKDKILNVINMIVAGVRAGE